MPPRLVLRTGMAHCFEGAMFAYAVNFLHGHEPRLLMLEASQDADHNLVVCRDPRTGLWGANAQSRYPGLVGRPAEYPSLRALADSYVPFYFSDRTLDPTDLTLVGYSEPIDLTAKFGTAWMGSEAPLWDIYYTYVDATSFSITSSTTPASRTSTRPSGPYARIGSGSTRRASPSSAWTTSRPERARSGTLSGRPTVPRTGRGRAARPARSRSASSA